MVRGVALRARARRGFGATSRLLHLVAACPPTLLPLAWRRQDQEELTRRRRAVAASTKGRKGSEEETKGEAAGLGPALQTQRAGLYFIYVVVIISEFRPLGC